MKHSNGFYIYCGVQSSVPLNAIPSDNTPAIIMENFMQEFYDTRLSDEQVEFRFRQFVRQLDYLKKRTVVVGILGDAKIPANRRHLLMRLMGMARQVATPVEVVKDPGRWTLFKEGMEQYTRKFSRIFAKRRRMNNVALGWPMTWSYSRAH